MMWGEEERFYQGQLLEKKSVRAKLVEVVDETAAVSGQTRSN